MEKYTKIRQENNFYHEIEYTILNGEITNNDIKNTFQANDIDGLKSALKRSIDQKTQELIFRGFEFNGKVMSMSQNAQINWTNMPNLEESDFPMIIMSKDDEPVQLQYSDKLLIWRAARNHSKNAQLSGGILKMQIDSITTIEEVLNFNDPR
jgi:hypothetical protein